MASDPIDQLTLEFINSSFSFIIQQLNQSSMDESRKAHYSYELGNLQKKLVEDINSQ